MKKWLFTSIFFIICCGGFLYSQVGLLQVVNDDISAASGREFANSKGGPENNRLENLNHPSARFGQTAFMHYVNKSGERSELAMQKTEIGKEYWYGWSMMIPEDFDHTGSYSIIMQLATYPTPRNGKFPCGANGPYMLIESGGRMVFKNQHKGEATDMVCENFVIFNDITDIKGKWIDFVMNARWTGDNDGFLKFWVKADDNNYFQKIDYKGATWWNDEDRGPYFKMGLYMGDPGWKGPAERVLYTDEFRLGRDASSFNEVAPPGPEARKSEAGKGEIEILTYKSALNKQDIVIRVYTPPSYITSGRRYPVIYDFHGAGGGSPERQWDRIFRTLTAAIETDQVEEMIYVFVNGMGDTFYGNSGNDSILIERSIIEELIPFIDNRYKTIASREGRCADGFSMGGFGSLMIALKHPDLFCSVVSYGAALIDAGRAVSRPGRMFSDHNHFNEYNSMSLATENQEQIRKSVAIRIVCGDKDGLLPNNLKFKKLLDSLNILSELVIVPGVVHDTKGLYQKTGVESLQFLENGRNKNILLKDIAFANTGDIRYKLDIYLPPGQGPFPVIVWIHGGAFKSGSKENPGGLFLIDNGFALVSINYRLSEQAKFPAQIHDCKAAVRWIRANGAKYNLKTDKIGVMGSSAGGHLAALVGTSGNVPELEGNVGGNLNYSSKVDAVVDLWGPVNFISIVNQPSEMNHENEESPEGLLLGGSVLQNRKLAKQASPVTYISKKTPPFLIIHGDKDPTVPHEQSIEMDSLLKARKIYSDLHIIKGMKHGGPEFETDEIRKMISDFFKLNIADNGKN